MAVRNEQGVSLLEVSLMLLATMALAAALAPTLSATLRDARATRANDDMRNIKLAIDAFKADGWLRFTEDGTRDGTTMELLVSDGDIPEAGSTTNWRETTATSDKDFLEEHLVLNSFNGVSYVNVAQASWRGAYINAPIDPDPWGNRYAVNVFYIGAAIDDDVVVLSAGPDEAVDTPDQGNPLTAVDDDLIFLVES